QPIIQILPLSLHDALPISFCCRSNRLDQRLDSTTISITANKKRMSVAPSRIDIGSLVWSAKRIAFFGPFYAHLRHSSAEGEFSQDRKSTRLNSSHEWISYS